MDALEIAIVADADAVWIVVISFRSSAAVDCLLAVGM